MVQFSPRSWIKLTTCGLLADNLVLYVICVSIKSGLMLYCGKLIHQMCLKMKHYILISGQVYNKLVAVSFVVIAKNANKMSLEKQNDVVFSTIYILYVGSVLGWHVMPNSFFVARARRMTTRH